MSQDLALQLDSSQLQTTSANFWRVSIIIISPLRTHFPLLNPTELRDYRFSFSLVLALGLALI
jgi:hypothetical protein